jgi:hypothetical protein
MENFIDFNFPFTITASSSFTCFAEVVATLAVIFIELHGTHGQLEAAPRAGNETIAGAKFATGNRKLENTIFPLSHGSNNKEKML